MMSSKALPAFPSRFSYTDAIPYEPGVTRRDPSPVVEVDGVFHVWYSKATVDPSGYYATVWHASSSDGHEWEEQAEAVGLGAEGEWDSNGVFTPSILLAEDRLYLFYTAVPKPFDNDNGGPRGTATAIGIAAAGSPHGPWRKIGANPILRTGPDGAWDSHRVDDACLLKREGRYWLYYKGRERGLSPAETKMGLAVAERPEGPYEKHSGNPIIDSGHEVCVWPHGHGVAAMLQSAGPQGNTVQYSPDGIAFEPIAPVIPPGAPGPYRADGYEEGWGGGIFWGLAQALANDRPHLVRFDVVE